MVPRLSVIVATLGRDTLRRALQSAADQPLLPGDELLVVGEGEHIERVARDFGGRFLACPVGGNFGYAERQFAMPFASGTHLLFLDDDDCYTAGAFASIRQAIVDHPGQPLMFRMVAPWGQVLWTEPVVRVANHGGSQFVVPNDPTRLGQWGTRYEGDFDFCVSTLANYPEGSLVWDDTVIYVCRPGDLENVS